MKRFIILLVLGLTGCCATEKPRYIDNFSERVLCVSGHYVHYYEITNPLDGHDYYLFRDEYSMIHSPECKKCKKPESILDSSSLFDY